MLLKKPSEIFMPTQSYATQFVKWHHRNVSRMLNMKDLILHDFYFLNSVCNNKNYNIF